MKKLFFVLGLFLIFVTGKSQYTCNTAVSFYSSTVDTIVMNTTTTAPAGPNYGCLGSQPNPAYVYLPVCGGGNFQIELSSTGSSDLDFIVWGPFYTYDINQICNDLNAFSGSGSDCSYSTSGTEIIDINNTVVGEYYLIMITNFGGTSTNAVLSQIGGTGIADTTCIPNNLNCGIYNMPVCEVTMNDSANHCKILWEKIPGLSVEQYYIHRLNAQSVYEIIDSIPENDSSFYIDYGSWPSMEPYRYKINYKDSCGNFNNLSSPHQSIHLQASPGFNSINLDWDSYIGINFPTYYILRGTDPFNMNVIDSISSVFTSFTDMNPIGTEPCYQVGFVNPNPCVITRSAINPVVSNVFNTAPTSVDELISAVNLKMYPNPANDLITIEIETGFLQKPSLEITDATGRLISSQKITQQKSVFDISALAGGVYFYSVVDENLRLNAGKLIIE